MADPAADQAAGPHTVSQLVALLRMEQIEENLFRAQNGPGSHVFGGQVLGQAIVAASRTVLGRRLHSLHAYFLKRGDHARPILFDVDRIRDGSSFTTRRVNGIQHGEAIFSLAASFQVEEEGFEHQTDMARIPLPEELPSDSEYYEQLARTDPSVQRFAFRFQAIDSRQVEGLRMAGRDARSAEAPRKHTWLRLREPLPDDPTIHAALLGYMSDLDFMSTAMLPHGPKFDIYSVQGASLDHAMWFHRPFRADDWLLFAKESPASFGARGFVRGQFFDRKGVLVASAAQECLMRPRLKDTGIAS